MKKIILFGLHYESNLGDQVIGTCVNYLLNKSIESKNQKILVVPVDMLGRKEHQSYTRNLIQKSKSKEFIKSFLSNDILKRINKLRNSLSDKKNSREIRINTRNLCENVIDSDVIGIVFAGGGIVKFKAQEFYLLIDEITKYADDRNIPVMLNAVGVEGFDYKSSKCRTLQHALNRKCIKVITTRDDLNTLNNKYLNQNNHCLTDKVADPAFWADVVYEKSIAANKIATVGLSVARSGIFEDHDISFNREDIMCFWKKLIELLDQNNISWRLFCNGTFADYDFLCDLLNEPEFINRKNIVALNRAKDGDELINQISSFDVVIACRLHAGIISYTLGVPEVMLVWNNKQIYFSELIGYNDRFLTRENITAENALKKIIQILEEKYPVYSKNLLRAKTYRILDEFVEKTISGEYDVL